MYQLEAKTLTYYDWNDIQLFLCDAMGIEERQFRNYHEVVGGDYKDLWHIWLDYFDRNVQNDSYTRVFLEHGADWMEYIEEDRARYGFESEWIKDFLLALDKLAEEVGEEIVIWYCW